MAPCNSPSGTSRANGSRAAKLAARARKRKSRAKPKPVIQELLAVDHSNFKDLVEQHTGGSHDKSAPATSFTGEDGASLKIGNNAADLQATAETHICNHGVQGMQGWSSGVHGSPGNIPEMPSASDNCADDEGAYVPLAASAGYITQGLKALEAMSALLVEPSASSSASSSSSLASNEVGNRPIGRGPACLQLGACEQLDMLNNVNRAGSIINAHIVRLLQGVMNSRGNHHHQMKGSGDELQALSLSCLALVLHQMTSLNSVMGERLH